MQITELSFTSYYVFVFCLLIYLSLSFIMRVLCFQLLCMLV